MISIKNDPFKKVIIIAKKLYPHLKKERVDVFFVDKMPKGVKYRHSAGMTNFPLNKNANIQIFINGGMPFWAVIETLAHELAHVICKNTDDGHGKIWKETFKRIEDEYRSLMEKNSK